MFAHAILERPLWGYGWDQTGQAHLAMALSNPVLAVHFGQAHNLILDVFLWVGVPLGLIISGAAVWSLGQIFHRLNTLPHLFVFGCLVIVGVHSMLELPLHYAYFLVPTGIFGGVLIGTSAFPTITQVPKRLVAVATVIAALVYALIIRDYFEVEARFRDMLHEKARIGTYHPGLLPDVIILNQLRESIALARYEPKPFASPSDLLWAEKVAKESPSMGNLYKLALLLAKNGQVAAATEWLQRACAVMSKTECVTLSKVWQQQADKDRTLAGVFPAEVLK
jgi:hypothetical protein